MSELEYVCGVHYVSAKGTLTVERHYNLGKRKICCCTTETLKGWSKPRWYEGRKKIEDPRRGLTP